jgi:hypothetical protein
MKFQYILVLLIVGLFLFGCTQDNGNNSSLSCPTQECTQDCSKCPAKVQYVDKPVTQIVTKYYCSDGKEVMDKTGCIEYVNTSWNISENKEELIQKLNSIKGRMYVSSVDVTKLVLNKDTVEISYTQADMEYQREVVGQTMFNVLKETINYLKINNNLRYNIKIIATCLNGGSVFSKITTKEDVMKINNYDIGADEWIIGISG